MSELTFGCTSNCFESGTVKVALLNIRLDGEQCWGPLGSEV